MQPIIDVIIPVFNEESSISLVIRDLPKNLVRNIIVSNNNSSDGTAEKAKLSGAIVVDQQLAGYGNTCQKGIYYLSNLDTPPDIVVFIDGDYSDFGEELPLLIKPIVDEGVDLVIGSRNKSTMEKGAMMPLQIFGNWLATKLIHFFYNYKFTDLGPFRAIKWSKLLELKMNDANYGWTVEMQVKAAKHKFKCREISVSYRKRIGTSKVSGTIRGSLAAGIKILWTIFKLLW